MIPILRGIRMAGEPTDRRFWTVVFLASVDFCCVLLATERYDKGDIKIGTTWLMAGVIFSLIGWKWPQIKRTIARVRDWVWRKPSKLVIHWANYRAVEGGGDVCEVGDFLRQIISGDSLVFDIENHNFKIGGKDFVPHDPLPFKEKRLQVNYSYEGNTPVITERREHGRLLLPEDSKIKWLMGEVDRLNKLYQEEHKERTRYQQDYANASNRTTEAENKLKELEAARPNPSQYPIPQLRAKVLSMVSELQGFLGAHGEEPQLPEVRREPGDTLNEFLGRSVARPLDPIMQWRAKFLGDFRITFGTSVPSLRDEIMARARKSDSRLNGCIDTAMHDPNGNVQAVVGIVDRFWEMAKDINC